MALDSSRHLQHLLPMHSMNVGVLEEASNITSSWPVTSAATACTSGFACFRSHCARAASLPDAVVVGSSPYLLPMPTGWHLTEVGPGAGILGDPGRQGRLRLQPGAQLLGPPPRGLARTSSN